MRLGAGAAVLRENSEALWVVPDTPPSLHAPSTAMPSHPQPRPHTSLAQEPCWALSQHTAHPHAALAALTLMMISATSLLDILVSPKAWMLKAPTCSVAMAGHRRATASRDSRSVTVPILPGWVTGMQRWELNSEHYFG